MPLESTIICVDNSEFMRNGDYIPNRLQAQQDAVNTVCRSKLMANPENNVGLLTLAKTQVLATLTTDGGRILTSLHKVQPSGLINFLTGIRIAHLALKHRQSKNHKMRIVVFVGSPIKAEEKDIVKIAKRLKKENVLVDIINFGETDENKAVLETFINTINGREGTGSSHLVTIPPSPHLSDALLSSPIIQGEEGSGSSNFTSGGGGFDFGVDPNEDPELALALRVSMEEQRQRQQEEEKQTPPKDTDDSKPEAAAAAAAETVVVVAGATRKTADGTPVQQDAKAGVASDEEMLQQALAMSLESGGAAMEEEEEGGVASSARAESGAAPPPAAAARSAGAGFPDFSTMTEEEQIAYAMQISLQGCQSKEEPMDVDEGGSCSSLKAKKKKKKEEDEKAEPDFSQVMSDPAFLQGVLQSLPGVDPESKVVRQAVGSLVGGQQEKSKGKNKEDEKAKDKGKKNKEDNDK